MIPWSKLPKFYIYCHTNKVNGKKYVGWTSLTVEKRWEHHCAESRRNRKGKAPFHRAIKKWGVDNWEHELLEVMTEFKSSLQAEILWIAHLKTFIHDPGNWGYNQTRGGDGVLGRRHTDETRAKLSEYRGENHHGYGKPGYGRGRKHTPEELEKMRLAKLGTKRSKESCEKTGNSQRGIPKGPNKSRGRPSPHRGKKFKCSICRIEGHNKLTCPTLKVF